MMLVVAGCSNPPEETAAAGPIAVAALTVTARPVTAYSSYPAKLEGVVNSAVRTKSAGYITDVFVDEGQPVTKGQPLFKLEARALAGQAAAARANINAARVEVEKLEPLVA